MGKMVKLGKLGNMDNVMIIQWDHRDVMTGQRDNNSMKMNNNWIPTVKPCAKYQTAGAKYTANKPQRHRH